METARIDSCPDGTITRAVGDTIVGVFDNASHDGHYHSGWKWACLPCTPWHDTYTELVGYWTNRCNRVSSACGGDYLPHNLCNEAWNSEVV